jgi:hypothetical protein
MSKILQQYRAMAAGGLVFRGLTVMRHEQEIGELVRRHGARKLLDYGCGAGEAYEKPHNLHERWGVDRPRRYDPAFPKFGVRPRGELFDGVICSDVLEHVQRESVPKFIATLFGHANRFVFASVCCRPAGKTFPDGTNLHVTIEPYDWWWEQFRQQSERRRGVEWVLRETP